MFNFKISFRMVTFMTLWSKAKELNTAYAVGEKLLKLITFLLVFCGGSVAGILAWMDPFFSGLSYFAYFCIALFFVLVFTLFIYLINLARSTSAKRKYYNSLSLIKVGVNPLNETFSDLMINIEDLRLPMGDFHKNKHFNRCHIIGPMAACIFEGQMNGCALNYCGEIIALPNSERIIELNGVVKFVGCSFIDCTFVQITILTTQGSAAEFKRNMPNYPVIGLQK